VNGGQFEGEEGHCWDFYLLIKAYIETGASGVHFKDQRETGSEKNAIIWEGR
jgi:isocitrate lyase